MSLAQAQCEACRADAPKVSDEELAELIREIPDWNIEVRGDHMELERVYLFKNFRHALAFTNAVGAIAEEVGIWRSFSKNSIPLMTGMFQSSKMASGMVLEQYS